MGPVSSVKLEPGNSGTVDVRGRKVPLCTVQASSLRQSEPQENEGLKAATEKRHVCEICDAAFTKPAHLRQHAVSHTGQRPFMCTHEGCSRSFKRTDHLRRHLLSHSHSALQCPIPGCPVTCTLPDNLRAHVKRHEAVHLRCFEPGCLFETAFKRQLWEHTRTAHEKRHVCQEPHCGKMFKFRSLLAAHTASMHGFTAKGSMPLVAAPQTSSSAELSDASEEGPTRSSTSGSCLRADEEGTSATPGFACVVPGCDSHFRQRRSLKQHLTVAHLRETRYPCSERGCSFSFFTKADLAHHTAVKHPSEGLVNNEAGGTDAVLELRKWRKEDFVGILNQPTYSCSESA